MIVAIQVGYTFSYIATINGRRVTQEQSIQLKVWRGLHDALLYIHIGHGSVITTQTGWVNWG